jgi:sugar phosphate isomerase/epimerase
MELSPAELVNTAHVAGFNRVCIFTQSPKDFPFPEVKPGESARSVKQALTSTGIKVYNVETFMLTPEVDIAQYRPALELGKWLGGTSTVAIGMDTDLARIADNFARFCELAIEIGLRPGIEFMAVSEVKTLDRVLQIVRAAGHVQGTVALDTLHMQRNATSPADIAQLPASMIGYVQICDAPLEMAPEKQWDEALGNRLPPGEGELPLHDFLRALPHDYPLSIEAPMNAKRDQGMNALERAKLLLAATRRVMSSI